MDTKNKLEFLNGLRGWAAFIVLLHHTLFYLIARVNPLFGGRMFAFITNGRLSVFVFFILSGFVLSIKFIRKPESGSLSVAATSRYFRLVIPVAATSFLAYLLLHFGFMFNTDAALISVDKSETNTWLAHFYQFVPSLKSFFIFSFYNTFFNFQEPVYNTNLWTMPYEFAGSMLIYFTLGVFKREDPDHPFKPSLLIATFLLFLFTPRIACFLFGYFFAEIYHRWKGPIERWKYCELFFGIMAIIPVILSTLFNFGEHDQYISLLALMLVTAATFFTPLRNFLNTRVSRFMGRISFPLYLVHIILICSLSSYLLLKLPRQGLGLRTTGYIDAAATILCSLLLACVFLPVETLSVSASKQIAKKLVAPFKSRKVLP